MQQKLKPDWAGEDLLSKLVNKAIETKPLYSLMKNQARRIMINTAEKKGISWRKTYQDLENSGAKELLKKYTNPNVVYPDYYQVPFHSYEGGDCCWEAAFEAPSATLAMALRVWPQEKLSPEAAHQRLRSTFHDAIAPYLPEKITDVLDVGCSIGKSTVTLHRYLCNRQKNKVRTVGLDLSPYMLAVAETLDETGEISEWIHGLAEDTDFADNSFDLVTIQYTLHELTHQATKNIFREILRILRPGGCLAIVDMNPTSPVIQNLPPSLFVLLKSTEPWLDQFYTLDVGATMTEIGFEYQGTIPSDPRHHAIVGIKPA
ncbi:MAG: class I SAM-dependent methyltransferase [Prochloraceae cyanobacterium]|nr:class I SAM-dependent methyltransferase [Prochloraceae cyanobacterium]